MYTNTERLTLLLGFICFLFIMGVIGAVFHFLLLCIPRIPRIPWFQNLRRRWAPKWESPYQCYWRDRALKAEAELQGKKS